jgi:lipopolysaccharide/colanic/teichoic acid biosynthesis glycosyltransferase
MTKRILDVLISACSLLLLAPALVAIGLAIHVKVGGSALFRQVRVGQGGRAFRIAKFRTMTDSQDSSGNLLPDEQRLTALGTFLRRTSFDELPQLWNVLNGDMSLVGPRPLLPEYVPRYSVFQRRRHDVKPGITGWAQVHGRNAVGWEQRFELDVWYVDNRSLWLDFKILWLTLLTAWQRDGISHAGHATMPEFMGNTEETRRA